jgi:hypothetical protein
MTETPTGKRRFRTHSNIFGKTWLVLQVEVKVEETEYRTDYSGLVPKCAGPYSYTQWRDARLTDLTEHNASNHMAKRPTEQDTRLKLETVGFSLFEMCAQRALILQVCTYRFVNTAGPAPTVTETWINAGVDDLGMKLEIIR